LSLDALGHDVPVDATLPFVGRDKLLPMFAESFLIPTHAPGQVQNAGYRGLPEDSGWAFDHDQGVYR
jgi:hypothetical protein